MAVFLVLAAAVTVVACCWWLDERLDGWEVGWCWVAGWLVGCVDGWWWTGWDGAVLGLVFILEMEDF